MAQSPLNNERPFELGLYTFVDDGKNALTGAKKDAPRDANVADPPKIFLRFPFLLNASPRMRSLSPSE